MKRGDVSHTVTSRAKEEDLPNVSHFVESSADAWHGTLAQHCGQFRQRSDFEECLNLVEGFAMR